MSAALVQLSSLRAMQRLCWVRLLHRHPDPEFSYGADRCRERACKH